jgi:anaerobic ribonucleoside-triphosphate reductase activating protein
LNFTIWKVCTLMTTPFSSSLKLNIAAISSQTNALGPGLRGVVWVQGCPLHCTGCIAPGWIPFVPALALSPEEILEKFDLETLDGLTFSGGEPMEQAAGLASVAQLARRKKKISIICFTGYRYERLVYHPPNPGVRDLLNELDVLIDGPYIREKNDSKGLRGSSNQRVIHLTSNLKHIDLESQKRRVELSIKDGEFSIVGIPTPSLNLAIAQAMHENPKG